MRLAQGSALIAAACLLACAACSRKPPPVAVVSPAQEAAVPELAGAPPASDAEANTPSADKAAEASAPAAATRVSGEAHPGLPDPLQPINRQLFKADRAMSGLAERTHLASAVRHTPGPARRGLSNLIANLNEPQAAANHLLQRRPGRTFRDAARFVINSTAGIGGLFDVAKKLGLRRDAASFGQTLASYGVKPGPYLYLPITGPTSVRDVVGTFVDGYFWPVHWLSLGAAPQQALSVARAGLQHVQPNDAPAQTQLASAKASPGPGPPKPDAYVAIRTAYERTTLPRADQPKPAQPSVPRGPVPPTIVASIP